MINSKEKWLLTASPWMRNSSRLLTSAPIAIGGLFLTALLVFAGQISNAQVKSNAISASQMHASGSNLVGTEMPAITGGNSVCLPGTTTLSNATSGGTWSSNNTGIATVGSTTGIVTAVAAGTATITYTVGSSYTYLLITVMGPTTGTATVCTGDVTTLSNTSVAGTWSSSNTAYATVTPLGVVTGVAAGNATISYTRPGCSVAFPLTVNPNTVSNITGSIAVCVSGVTALGDATPSGTWSSSNTALATVDASGNVTGVAVGTPNITYALGGCYKTRTITVNGTNPAAITGSNTICTGNVSTLADVTTGGTWSSSNLTNVTITTAGVISGIDTGTSVISYTKTGCSSTFTVTVNANTVGAITGNLVTCVGGITALADTSVSGIWSSNNTALATVNASGNVTGVAVGAPVIKYTKAGCYKTATVTVNNTAPAAISGANTVCTSSTIALADATLGGTWSSSDLTKATVNAYGVVTGVGAGSPNITYTKLGCSAILPITVNATPSAIGGTLSVCAGNSTALTNGVGGGTWTSSATSIATVNAATGSVTGIAAGTTAISYTVGGCSATAVVTVNSPAAITGGNTLCFAPMTYLYLYSSTLGGTWSSSNTSVATVTAGVSSSNAITPKAAGTSTISYTVGGCSVTQVITVNWAPGAIGGNTDACIGGSTLLTDTTVGGTWTSSATSIATVNAATGNVTGIAAGSTTITYANAAGCLSTTTVLINANPLAITGTASVCTGFGITTLADATVGGSWTSSNPAIAQVNGAGVVTGLATGNATISYNVAGCAAIQVVTVNANAVGSITGTPAGLCIGTAVTLTETTTGGTWSYSTSYGSGTVSFTTVDATHELINGVVAGTTMISYTAANGCIKTTSVLGITAGAGTIVGAYSICNGATTTLTNPTATGGVWTSGNTSIATVSAAGVVTGVNPGALVITYAMPGGCETYMPFTVNVTPSSILGYYTGISANYMAVGTAACTPLPGAQLSDSTHGGTWSTTAGTGSLSIDALGNLTGLTAGTANVTYTVGTCYATQVVTVGAVVPTITGSTVCAGNTLTLTVNPAIGGNNKIFTAIPYTDVIAYSSNVITGVAPGTATITYVANGCYTTKSLTVVANAVSNIFGSNNVCVSGTAQLYDTTASGTWSSLATSIATVSPTGLVTGVAVGYANIKYTVGTCWQYYEMSVNNTHPLGYVGTTTVCAGSSTALVDSTAGGTWTTDNAAVATVTVTGIVTGVSAGTANINYVLNGCGLATPIVYTVNASPSPITGTLTVCSNGTTPLSDATLGGTWSSATPGKATVSAVGLVSGVAGNGTTVISYTLSGCAATATVTVGTLPTAISVANLNSFSICIGALDTLKDVTDANGQWSSSNLSVVNMGVFASAGLGWPYGTSTSGAIIGNSAGTATISFVTPGCTAVTHTVTVNAVAPISGTPSVCTLSTTVFSDTGAGTWSSSASSIATVNPATGSVYGVAAGSATITYTSTNGCTATQAVFVSNCVRSGNAGGSAIQESNASQSYTVYPNPSNGEITFTQSMEVDATLNVRVVNYVGATVYTGTMQFTGGKGQLNIDYVNAGMYLVQLADNNGNVQSFKLVIEK